MEGVRGLFEEEGKFGGMAVLEACVGPKSELTSSGDEGHHSAFKKGRTSGRFLVKMGEKKGAEFGVLGAGL